MEIYKKILKNQLFYTHLESISNAEKTRIFCCHGMEHLLDVARIAMLINLERDLSLSKDLIYSTALLHDLGRSKEYEDGTPHDVAGLIIARDILSQCDATQEIMNTILNAIGNHRGQDISSSGDDLPDKLSALIKEADKLSRPCFNCKAESECKWPDDKKNWVINY